MPYTITILNDSPQALAYVKEAETLDFVKVTKTKETKKKTTTKAKATPAPELLEEDETEYLLHIKRRYWCFLRKQRKQQLNDFMRKGLKKVYHDSHYRY